MNAWPSPDRRRGWCGSSGGDCGGDGGGGGSSDQARSGIIL